MNIICGAQQTGEYWHGKCISAVWGGSMQRNYFFNKDFMHSIVDTIIYYYMTGVFVCQCDKCANWQCAAPQMTNETDLCIALVVFCHYHYYMQWQEMGLFDVHCSHVRMNNPVDIKQK